MGRIKRKTRAEKQRGSVFFLLMPGHHAGPGSGMFCVEGCEGKLRETAPGSGGVLGFSPNHHAMCSTRRCEHKVDRHMEKGVKGATLDVLGVDSSIEEKGARGWKWPLSHGSLSCAGKAKPNLSHLCALLRAQVRKNGPDKQPFDSFQLLRERSC